MKLQSLSFGVLQIALCYLSTAYSLAVMSVDLGSEWMKIAVVSPGMPMEICLNKDSQRKTPVVVAFRDGERQYGDLALSTQIKFPNKAFSNFLDLLGKPIDHPVVQNYIERFPFYKISSDEKTGAVVFTHPEGMVFSVEELVAMALKNAQATAQATAGQKIKDAVITVPPYFNQAERRALARAVKIAGINLLQLMNDNTAVALNYGAFRRKEFNATATNILFYDMGTGSTSATVVSYQTGKTKDRGYVETAPIMTVRGVGFDRSLGGLEFKLRLAEHLANKFDELKKTSKKVRDHPRSLFKIYKEAERVKKILSANTEINAQIENVLDEVDLKVAVTRQEFEEMTRDLLERVTQPIDDALSSSEITLDEISQVIVVGGNTRIPKIQEIILAYLNGKGISKSINADEAAAMGAAYQAAYLSKGFKVLTFVAKDANLYPIQVEFSRDGTKNIQRVVFNRNNEIPKKKTILASRMEKDFTVYANYGDLSFLSKKDKALLGSTTNISSLVITGVQGSIEKHAAENAELKGVRIHMSVDASGLFSFDQAETLLEKEVIEEEEESTLSKIGSTIGKIFGSYGDDKAADENQEAAKNETTEQAGAEKQAEGDNVNPDTTGKQESEDAKKKSDESEKKPEEEKKENASTSENEKSDENEKKEENAVPGIQKPEEVEKKKVVKKLEIKEPLEKELSVHDIRVATQEEIEASLKKLQDLDDKDKARLELDKARNALESFLHETKDRLQTDEYQRASTDEERNTVLETVNKEQEWLEYESDSADTETLKSKLTAVAGVAKDILDRVAEHRDRPQAIESLENLLKISADYLAGLEKIDPEDSVFSKTELSNLEKVIKETKEWLIEQKSIQEKVPLSQTPTLTMKSIFEKIQVLDRETKYLMNKARYAPPKKKVKKEEKKKDEAKEEKKDEEEQIVVEDDKPIQEDIPKTDEETASKGDAESNALPEPDTTGDTSKEGVHTEL